MALEKAITQSNGFDATYWRIDQMQVDWRRSQARIRLSGYKDKAKRNADPNGAVMEQRNFSINGVEFQEKFGTKDLDEVDAFDKSVDYAEGDLVKQGNQIYEAETDIPAGGDQPKKSSAWVEYSPTNVSRSQAYGHVKNNSLDFVDAVDV